MKWHAGNDFPNFDGDGWKPESWNKLKEPRPEWLNLLGIPVGLLLIVGVGCLWAISIPNIASKEVLEKIFESSTLLIFVGLIIPHEFIHLILHPAMGRTSYSIVGVIPKHFLFFAAYLHDWSCRRFVICLAAPFICISLLPALLSGLGFSVHPVFIQASFVNAFISSGDVIALALLLTQVPSRARVRNSGFQSYWSR